MCRRHSKPLFSCRGGEVVRSRGAKCVCCTNTTTSNGACLVRPRSWPEVDICTKPKGLVAHCTFCTYKHQHVQGTPLYFDGGTVKTVPMTTRLQWPPASTIQSVTINYTSIESCFHKVATWLMCPMAITLGPTIQQYLLEWPRLLCDLLHMRIEAKW